MPAPTQQEQPTNGTVAGAGSEEYGRRKSTAAMQVPQPEIQDAITHPGDVRINVQGAFIVDEEDSQPSTPRSEDYEHDPKDIRLPNHTAVVSHIAVDVSSLPSTRPTLLPSKAQNIHAGLSIVIP